MLRITTAFLFVAMFVHDGVKTYGQVKDSTRKRNWYVPTFVPVQYAGNIGLISAGIGYSSRLRNYQLGILYGYVPRSVAGSDVHTVTARNVFPITRYALKNNNVLIPYVGVGLSFEVGGNAFFRMPDHFPDSYYDYPKNMRVLPYGGAKVQHVLQDDFHGLRGIELYAEAGTVDLYVWYKAMSHDIRLREIFSLAIGVNFLIAD